MTTAFTMLAVKVSKEKRIPFEIVADPFYSEQNQNYLRRRIDDTNRILQKGNAIIIAACKGHYE